ncbi:MAG: hypothetical protein GY714_27700 [Desulfobacterales bacterium]|nr:hypothetical protein [Desulfobacterales bacterium]MCP4163543.1 hypothetical protein [Deltaproteobacteria bacterium]
MGKKIGIILSIVVVALVVVYFVATSIVENKIADVVDAKINNSKLKITYDKISTSLISSKTTIYGIKYDEIKINEIVVKDIYSYDQKSAIPSNLNIEVNGILFSPKKINPMYAKTLNDIGYGENMVLDYGLNYSYDKEKKSLNIKDFKVDFHDAFKTNLKLNIENLNLNLNDPGSMVQLVFLYPTLKIKNAALSYTEDSFLKRVIEVDSKKRGKTVEDIKAEVVKAMDMKIKLAKNETQKKFFEGFKNFLMDPQSFNVTISPDKPVAIKDIMKERNPDNIITKLNMKFE